jgi:hypothetical protein
MADRRIQIIEDDSVVGYLAVGALREVGLPRPGMRRGGVGGYGVMTSS